MSATSDRAAIRELESRLHRPDRGENGFREGAEARSRLDALARLREHAEEGKVSRESQAGGINTHIHTAKSFGFFASPSHAVWEAYLSRLAVFGINDHNTLEGHEEFGRACKIAGIRAALSLEVIAVSSDAMEEGALVNDPANPGRVYFTAKGVTRPLPAGSRAASDFEAMNAALLERHREMTEALASHLASKLGQARTLDWNDVLALTPHDRPTERHVAQAAAAFLERAYPEPALRADAVKKAAGAAPPDGAMEDPARFQDFLRASLLKAKKPAYVAESKKAFLRLERALSLALALGAIPTYPFLGDPVTAWEEDVDRLLDRLEAANIHAVEVLPDRISRERLSAIVSGAAKRGMPVFNGTEHNTKSPAPLVDRFFFDPEFRPHFERGARVLLGHQALRASGGMGYVDEEGHLPPGDREANLARLDEAGRRR